MGFPRKQDIITATVRNKDNRLLQVPIPEGRSTFGIPSHGHNLQKARGGPLFKGPPRFRLQCYSIGFTMSDLSQDGSHRALEQFQSRYGLNRNLP